MKEFSELSRTLKHAMLSLDHAAGKHKRNDSECHHCATKRAVEDAEETAIARAEELEHLLYLVKQWDAQHWSVKGWDGSVPRLVLSIKESLRRLEGK